MTIPSSHADLLERAAYWHVATIGPDGEPQSSPVWCGTDDEGNVVFSMLAHRQKSKNLKRCRRLPLGPARRRAGDRTGPSGARDVDGLVAYAA